MLFDTRYFWAVFTTKNAEHQKELRKLTEDSKARYASTITLYEIYKLTLRDEEKTVADLRVNTVKRQFRIVDVSSEIAEEGAKISHRLQSPMADSLIMATAKSLRIPCVTDDPHFTEVKTVWV